MVVAISGAMSLTRLHELNAFKNMIILMLPWSIKFPFVSLRKHLWNLLLYSTICLVWHTSDQTV